MSEEKDEIFTFPDSSGIDTKWKVVLRQKVEYKKQSWMFDTDEEYREYLKNYKDDE